MRERRLCFLCNELLTKNRYIKEKSLLFLNFHRLLFLKKNYYSVLRNFSTTLQKMFSVTNIGGLPSLEVPMPHHFETHLGISTMSFGKFVTKLIKSFVFITIIMSNQQNKLASPFKFSAIGFLSLAHANNDYDWMSKALDVKLRNLKIPLSEMGNDTDYFLDGKKKDEVNVDIIGKIKTKLAKEIFNNPRIKVKDEQACDDFVDRVDFMFKMKSDALYPLRDRPAFNIAYAAYTTKSKAPGEVDVIDEFIIFLDISQLHSDGVIDFSDLRKVHDSAPASKRNVQIAPVGVQGQGQGGQGQQTNIAVNAIDKLSENFNKLYEVKKDKKYEALVPYDATSQKGCPQEGIDKYKKWTEEFSFLPTSHFKPFNNPLTVESSGKQVDRRIIMIPLNGHGLLMDKSGQVYRYLFS